MEVFYLVNLQIKIVINKRSKKFIIKKYKLFTILGIKFNITLLIYEFYFTF